MAWNFDWAVMNHVRTIFFITLAVMATGTCVAEDEHPEKVILDLYEAHQPWRDKELDYGCASDLSRLLTPELVARFVREITAERIQRRSAILIGTLSTVVKTMGFG